MNYFFDTYALIEMIRGNPNYAKFVEFEPITTILNLGELHYHTLKEKSPIDEFLYSELKGSCMPIELEDMEKAMEFKYENRKKKFSMVDSVGYILARRYGLRFLTGDKGFREIEGVEFVE
jgi:predicted nucleic acid-binding protein